MRAESVRRLWLGEQPAPRERPRDVPSKVPTWCGPWGFASLPRSCWRLVGTAAREAPVPNGWPRMAVRIPTGQVGAPDSELTSQPQGRGACLSPWEHPVALGKGQAAEARAHERSRSPQQRPPHLHLPVDGPALQGLTRKGKGQPHPQLRWGHTLATSPTCPLQAGSWDTAVTTDPMIVMNTGHGTPSALAANAWWCLRGSSSVTSPPAGRLMASAFQSVSVAAGSSHSNALGSFFHGVVLTKSRAHIPVCFSNPGDARPPVLCWADAIQCL